MKNKGFTLIELLSIIVVLSILSLIVIPMIAGVVENVKKNSAKQSALGYINAIESKVETDNLKGIDYPDKDDYYYDEISAKVKGNYPSGGMFTLHKGKVTESIFCINSYIVKNKNNNISVGVKCNGDDLKESSTLKLSKESVNLTYPSTSELDIIENTSGGIVRCKTDDSSVATCDVKNNKLIVKSGKKEGHTTITLTSKGNRKYKDASILLLVNTTSGLLSITASGYSATYDGKAHGISVSSPDAIIKYGTSEGVYNLDESPTFTEAGKYVVYYEVLKEGYKTIRGSKTIAIYLVPSCELQVTNDGVSFAKKNVTELKEFGISKDDKATYNNKNSLELSTGTFYGYIKDEIGNTAKCSVTLTNTQKNTKKVSKTCQKQGSAYGWVHKKTEHIKGINVTLCSGNIKDTCTAEYSAGGIVDKPRCYVNKVQTNSGCKGLFCGEYDNYYYNCEATKYAYSWINETAEKNPKTCTNNHITCDNKHVDQTYVDCINETPTCSSGIKLNDNYCYKKN